MEARDERRLMNLQKQMSRLEPADHRRAGIRAAVPHRCAELLFEIFSQRYERGSILVTTNLPFDAWTAGLRLGTADRSRYRTGSPTTSTSWR